MSACHSRILRATFLRRLEVGHEFAVVNVDHVSGDAENPCALLWLLVAPLRKGTASLREVADVAVGHGNELDLVPVGGPQRGHARRLELGIVRVRAERDDVQRTRGGGLKGNGGHTEREEDGDRGEDLFHGGDPTRATGCRLRATDFRPAGEDAETAHTEATLRCKECKRSQRRWTRDRAHPGQMLKILCRSASQYVCYGPWHDVR